MLFSSVRLHIFEKQTKIMNFLLLLLLVWNASISFVTSQQPPVGRQNTQCESATLVPSVVTIKRPYIENTTFSFDVKSGIPAESDRNPPQIYTCPESRSYRRYDPTLIGSVRSAWYKFTPSISNYYDISPSNIYFYSEQWVSIIEGTSCSTIGTNSSNVTEVTPAQQKPLVCQENKVGAFYLQSGKTYFITVFVPSTWPSEPKRGEKFIMIIKPPSYRPPLRNNTQCTSAIVVPPIVTSTKPYIENTTTTFDDSYMEERRNSTMLRRKLSGARSGRPTIYMIQP